MVADVDLAHLVHGLPDAVMIVSDEVVTWANTAAHASLGYEPGELVGLPAEVLFPASEELPADVSGDSAVTAGIERIVRHHDGWDLPAEITAVDLDDAGVAFVVRDLAVRRSFVGQLVANTELVTAMTRGATMEDTLRIAARHVRTIVRADACWAAVTPSGEGRIAVVARDGAEEGSGGHVPDGDHHAGPLLVVQLGGADVSGLLAVARRPGAREFTAVDREVVRQFAGVITIALDLDGVRRRAARAEATAEHARISRELHDSVMQRLFAEGLLLETAMPLASSPVAERINAVVTNLDDVIREIRETIFEHPPAA